MLTKRIIPCLDVKDGRAVKGTKFLDLQDSGDPVELARRYADEGADELVFLDISATTEKRKTLKALVQAVAKTLNIPFTVGGGISSVDDIKALLESGADKVSINSAAVKNPSLLNEAASFFGSQCIVLAIDAKKVNGKFKVFINAGTQETDFEALKWALEAQERGAGEVLLTSIDHDGTGKGFAIELTESISRQLLIPLIASGGAGSASDFIAVFKEANAAAALAAGIFHRREIEIGDLKRTLFDNDIAVRL